MSKIPAPWRSFYKQNRKSDVFFDLSRPSKRWNSSKKRLKNKPQNLSGCLRKNIPKMSPKKPLVRQQNHKISFLRKETLSLSSNRSFLTLILLHQVLEPLKMIMNWIQNLLIKMNRKFMKMIRNKSWTANQKLNPHDELYLPRNTFTIKRVTCHKSHKTNST